MLFCTAQDQSTWVECSAEFSLNPCRCQPGNQRIHPYGATLAEAEEEQLFQTGSICCPLVHAMSTVVGNVSIPLLQVLLNCVSFLLMLVPSSWQC